MDMSIASKEEGHMVIFPPHKHVTKERGYKCKMLGTTSAKGGAWWGKLWGGGRHGPKVATWHGAK